MYLLVFYFNFWMSKLQQKTGTALENSILYEIEKKKSWEARTKMF